MRIIFFGSSSFAVESLKALTGRHEVLAVFTQPDRRKGRHLHLAKTPVKVFAQESNIDIFQPEKVSGSEVINKLNELKADLFVVVSFGQKLSLEVLNVPELYCINVHASLLPKYRGAAPINYAIVNGDETTGVSIIKMNEFMDGGDIIFSKSMEIGDDDSIVLTEKLGKLGAYALLEALEIIKKGEVEFTKQEASLVSKANKLKKENGRIDWQESAEILHNKVRGLLPWPCAFSYYKGKFLKILKSRVVSCSQVRGENIKPAEVVLVCKHEGFIVACGKGDLRIERLQPEGKRAMSAHDFILGHHVQTGDILGHSE